MRIRLLVLSIIIVCFFGCSLAQETLPMGPVALFGSTPTKMQVLSKPFNYRLWKLQDESPDVIRKTLITYLEDEGWTANISPLGPKMQSEFAISFEWLGIKPGSKQYVRIPDLHICGGLMLTRTDPEYEKIMAMTLDERKAKYPSLFWPESSETHPLNAGPCPETIAFDPHRSLAGSETTMHNKYSVLSLGV